MGAIAAKSIQVQIPERCHEFYLMVFRENNLYTGSSAVIPYLDGKMIGLNYQMLGNENEVIHIQIAYNGGTATFIILSHTFNGQQIDPNSDSIYLYYR